MIQLPDKQRAQVEEIKRQYADAATPLARIAVLNDASLGSFVTRTLAAVEIHDEVRS